MSIQIHYSTNNGNSYLNILNTFRPQMQRHLTDGMVPSMIKHCVYEKNVILKNS